MAEKRGGSRQGSPGKLYPNRRDMSQPKVAAQGQPYGQRGAQEASLSKQPLANNVTQLPTGNPQQSQRVPVDDMRGKIPSLSDPSTRPQEPVTAGLPIGPGAGPEALNIASGKSQELATYRAIFLAHPNEDLRRMIEYMERNL